MAREYHYLTAPNYYLFWNKEDGPENMSLDITAVEKITRKASSDVYGDTDRFSGFYYDSRWGWSAIWDESVKYDKEHFPLICKLEDVGDCMTPKVEMFLRKCLTTLFSKNIKWER